MAECEGQLTTRAPTNVILTSLYTKAISHAQSSSNLLKMERGEVTPELLQQYPNSPTAQTTVKALKMFENGFLIFWNFKRNRVLTQKDCEDLQPGFHDYIQGYILANYLRKQYPTAMLPPSIFTWTEDYMRLRPNDTLVEYFNVSIIVPLRANGKLDYEQTKSTIRALEQFAHKLEEYKSIDSERHVLGHAYFTLGARYMATDQEERARDSIGKLYEIDNKNLQAIYFYAYTKRTEDPKSALKLFEKYLSVAPRCHENYANTLYIMADIYLCHFRNIQKGKLYYKKGKNAEKFRLPFDGEVDLPQKKFLQMFELQG